MYHTRLDTAEPLPPVAELDSELTRQLESGELDLPLFPATAFKVFELAQDPDANAQAVAALVETDQKIAASVLRVANSAAFGGSSRITTLRQAVTRTGLKTLGEIVLSTALRSGVFQESRFLGPMQDYWREGVGAALWGKELARLRKANVETAYMCGLLHNVGKPLALNFLLGLCGGNIPRLFERVCELAPLIGTRIGELWHLPQPARVCITHHEHYTDAPEHREEACTVSAAMLLTRHMYSDDACPRADLEQAGCFAELNLYPQDLDRLLTKKKRLAAQLESF